MLEYVWGLKTHAMLDVWSMEHVLSGLSIGHIIKCLNGRIFLSAPGIQRFPAIIRYFDLIGVLFLVYLWESIEHFLETGAVGGNVEFWFQGVEYWPLLADTNGTIKGTGAPGPGAARTARPCRNIP